MNRKFLNVMTVISIAVLGVQASCCKKKNDPKPKDDPSMVEKKKPVLTFKTGTEFVFIDGSHAKNKVLQIGIIGTAEGNSKLKQLQVKISTNGGASAILKDTLLNSLTINWSHTFKVTGNSGDIIKLTYTLISDNGEYEDKALTFKVFEAINVMQIGEIGHREKRTVLNSVNTNKLYVKLTGSLHHVIGTSPPYSNLGINHCSTIDQYRQIYNNGANFKFFIILDIPGNQNLIYVDYFEQEIAQNRPDKGIMIENAKDAKVVLELVPLRNQLIFNSDCGTGGFVRTEEMD